MLPAFEKGLEDIAFVHLGVAEKGDHPAFRLARIPAFCRYTILDQGGEQGLRHAQSDRPGREIDIVDILGS